jgi:hypothetical protein
MMEYLKEDTEKTFSTQISKFLLVVVVLILFMDSWLLWTSPVDLFSKEKQTQ